MTAKKMNWDLMGEGLAKNSAETQPPRPIDLEGLHGQQPPASKSASRELAPLTFDFRSGKPLPSWARDLMDTHLAIESEDAKSSGSLGFMARALVTATMPYKDPKTDAFVRQNGDFRLRIVAGYEGGIPFGIYPRLMMSWVATEAVRKQSPVIELGDSLSLFLRDVLELKGTSGGVRGSGTRVTEQMKRLFGSLITAQYSGSQEHRGFTLKNVLIADELQVNDADAADFDAAEVRSPAGAKLWVPQARHEAGQWRSQVRLSDNFFKECIDRPIPIDLRAYKALRASPMAMDVYTWLTYRMSYTVKRSRPIRWEALMLQFGTGLNTSDMGQAVRNFKKSFLSALQMVLVIYPDAKLEVTDIGLVLVPSRPHVLPSSTTRSLPSKTQPGLF